MRLRLGVCSSSNSGEEMDRRSGSQAEAQEIRAEMWTQESEKKVVRTRISNEATDNSEVHVPPPVPPSVPPLSPPSSSPPSVPVMSTGSPSSPHQESLFPPPEPGAEPSAKKTGHGTDGIRDQELNNECTHRQSGRKVLENELISPLVCRSPVAGALLSCRQEISSGLETTAAAEVAKNDGDETSRTHEQKGQNQMTLKLTSERV